jgi:hypothetical protein
MQFFIYLILFLCISVKYSSSNYILCTPKCTQITVSFLQPLTIPIACQKDDNVTNIYEDALSCIIDYRIDYDAEQIYINFQASNDTNLLKEQNQSEFLIQSVWLGFDQESNQPNITHRKYGCNIKTDCARLFYLNTIQRLIIDGKLKLDEITLKLYNQSKPTRRRCKDSSKTGNKSTIPCGNGLCYAHNIDKKQYCTTDNTPMFFSEIEYHLPKLMINEREVIEYKCNKHLCNTNETIKKIEKILLDYTNWNNNNNNNSIIKNEEQNPIKEKSSTIQQTVSYYLIILSLINLQFLF